MDHATGRSRGTGFACFWKIEDANRAVQQSELLRSETTGQTVVVSLLVLMNKFILLKDILAQEKSIPATFYTHS